ncbi:MAG: nitroreductase [Perlucidibaca sp.]
MQLYEAIHGRRSLPQLGSPVPDAAQLARVFAAAGRAPDHRLLRPWRYLVVTGEARSALGELFLEAVTASDPERALNDAAKLRQMPLRAPMILVAILRLQAHPTVPDWEQWLSLGASVQNLLLALHGEGFAGMWRSGDLAGHPRVQAGLGLAEGERIGGFIYVGTPAGSKAAPAEPESLWQDWTPAS